MYCVSVLIGKTAGESIGTLDLTKGHRLMPVFERLNFQNLRALFNLKFTLTVQ